MEITYEVERWVDGSWVVIDRESAGRAAAVAAAKEIAKRYQGKARAVAVTREIIAEEAE